MKITQLADLIEDMISQFPGTPLEIINEIGEIVKEEAKTIMIMRYFTPEESIQHGLTTQEELDTRFKDVTFNK